MHSVLEQRVSVCVCVDALTGFGPGQRVLMGLMLRERELQFVPPSERQRQMSAGPAA